jgi:hypothetical protein
MHGLSLRGKSSFIDVKYYKGLFILFWERIICARNVRVMHFQPQGKIRSVWFRYLYSVNSIKTGTITPAVFLKPKMVEIEANLVNT